MLVKKRVEMWDAVQLDDGRYQLTDKDGKQTEMSESEFHAIYEAVPERHASRRQKGILVNIQEVLQNDGEVQTDQ